MTTNCYPTQTRPLSEVRLHTVHRSDGDCLYKEFAPLVQKLIRQYGDTDDLRDDLRSEIYCRFRAIVDAYDPNRGIPLKPYVVRMLTASIYSYARHGWIRRTRERSLDSFQEDHRELGSEDPTTTWDDQMETERILQIIPSELSHLSNRQRQVLVWRYYEGRSFEWMAAELEVKTPTARSLLRHALANLRARLISQSFAEYGEDSPIGSGCHIEVKPGPARKKHAAVRVKKTPIERAR